MAASWCSHYLTSEFRYFFCPLFKECAQPLSGVVACFGDCGHQCFHKEAFARVGLGNSREGLDDSKVRDWRVRDNLARNFKSLRQVLSVFHEVVRYPHGMTRLGVIDAAG